MNISTLEARPALIHQERDGGNVYNEAAFRYLLARERRRAEQSNQPLVLVLVNAKKSVGSTSGLSRHTAVVFSVLNECVREVDFVGWYREGKIASALVSVGGAGSNSARQTLHSRVTRVLREKLQIGATDDMLRVRVVELSRKLRT